MQQYAMQRVTNRTQAALSKAGANSIHVERTHYDFPTYYSVTKLSATLPERLQLRTYNFLSALVQDVANFQFSQGGEELPSLFRSVSFQVLLFLVPMLEDLLH